MTTSLPVKSIATRKLVTIETGTPLHQAQAIMEDKRIRHLPVVDSANCIIGVLSKHDLKAGFEAQNLAVDFFMNAPVESIGEDTPLRPAIFKMLEKKISCLLVEDKNQEAIGIITTDDLLWQLAYLLKEDAQQKHSWFDTTGIKATIGEVAHKLSLAGI